MRGRCFAAVFRRVQRNPFRFVRLGLGCVICLVLISNWTTKKHSKAPGLVSVRIRAQMVKQDSSAAEGSFLEALDPLTAQISESSTTADSAALSLGQNSSDVSSKSNTAVAEPIRIAIMTEHYFGDDYSRQVPDCTMDGKPLECTFFDAQNTSSSSEAESWTATWWHAPHICHNEQVPSWELRQPNRSSSARGNQLAVISSMESSIYFPCLENKKFMAQFDVSSTYSRASDVPLLYFGPMYKALWESEPPVPFSEKLDAVVFVNSNCITASRRELIVAALAGEPGIRLDSLGPCLVGPAQLPRQPGMKHLAFRRYKFCIAMENSAAEDYVTEKVYDALAAGCVPVYYGAPNIEQFIPTKDSIINYRDFLDPTALAKEIKRLSHDESAYNAKLAWRDTPELWSESFKSLVQATANPVHPQCQICQVVAQRRFELSKRQIEQSESHAEVALPRGAITEAASSVLNETEPLA